MWIGVWSGYKPRYFFLKGDHLYLYLKEENFGEEAIQSVCVQGAIVPYFGPTGFRIWGPQTVEYDIQAASKVERQRWLGALKRAGAILVARKDYRARQIFRRGHMIPQLTFPIFTSEKWLLTLLKKDHESTTRVLDHLRGGGAASAFVGEPLPQVFRLFGELPENIDKKVLEPNVKRVDVAILRAKIMEMKTKVEGVERQFRQIVNPAVLAQHKNTELTIVVLSCEELLAPFLDKNHVLWKYPLIASPFLVHLAYLCVIVTGITITMFDHHHHHHQSELQIQLNELVKGLKRHKEKCVQKRLEAITKPFLWVNDYLYPNPGTKGDVSSVLDVPNTNLFNSYRIMIQGIYESYFNVVLGDCLKVVEAIKERAPWEMVVGEGGVDLEQEGTSEEELWSTVSSLKESN